MTRKEFTAVMAYITAGIQKPLPAESAEVYFDLLGDLRADVFQVAAQRVMTEHVWATFPSVAELRQAAAETMRGELKELSAAEAWKIAWGKACKIDLDMAGSAERHLEAVPSLVREAIVSFGLPALCYGKEPVGVVRGQFLKIYEQLAARERRQLLLPDKVKRQIADTPKKMLPKSVVKAIAKIGVEGKP